MDTIFQQNGFSIERLTALCRIKEAGGIAEAARRDPRKQSLISRQISELEEATGLRLLDRTQIPHKLTEEGLQIESKTRGYIKDLESYLASKSGMNETITVAAGESIILWYLIPHLSKFSSEEQGRIRFRNMRSNQAANAVASGMVDLAIHHTKDKHKRCENSLLAEYSLCLAAKKGVLPNGVKEWKELEGLTYSIATLEGGGSTRAIVDELTHKYPNAPQVGLECTSHPQILEACRTGKFLGIVPEIANPKFLKRPISDEGVEYVSLKELTKKKVSLSLSYHPKRADSSELLKKLISVMGR